jgi:hypothetical protein
MIRNKFGLRLIIFLSILMFLSITLLIPNTSAIYTAYGSTADTIYDTTPTAYANCPSNTMANFTGPDDVVFKVDYTFENDHASEGSYHMAILIVVRTQPSPADWETNTGWVFIAPGNSDSDCLTLSDYVANGNGYSYNIEVECRVKKNLEDITYTSDMDSYTWSV